MSRRVQNSASSSAAPESTMASVQDVDTPPPNQQSITPNPDRSTSSHRVQRETDSNADDNVLIAPSQTPKVFTVASSSQDVATSTLDNNFRVAPVVPQAVIDGGGNFVTSSSTTQSLPVSRTGLIRPSFTSTYTRPEDPVAHIQPGIAAASAFFLCVLIATSLFFVRRWRRHRTQRRTRSVVNLLNKHQVEGGYMGVGNTKPPEKLQINLTLSDVESGFVPNNAGVGTHTDPAIDELRAPITAKMRPHSVKGFKESAFPTTQRGLSSVPGVKFALPYVPAKPSPLRES